MKKFKFNEEYPWYQFYGDVPKHLDYPQGSMVDLLLKTALKYPDYCAYEFFNNKCSYKNFLEDIEKCARGLKRLGVKEGDVVSICMPNTPQAITVFYAVNMVGAVSNMIHPLSSEKEIELYLNKSNSSVIFTIDICYKKVINIINDTNVKKVIVGSVGDDLRGFKRFFYNLFKTDLTKAIKKIRNVFLKAFQNRKVISFKKFMQKGESYVEDVWVSRDASSLAVILYSGGTTGTPKGIMLSNLNFNALATQAHLMCDPAKAGDTVLSIMPIFHGFGLGVCIHTPLCIGMKCVLVPTFKIDGLVKLIKSTKPNFFVGVPTLFEALVKNKNFKEDSLASIHTVVSGGDIMDDENLKKYNEFLASKGSKAKIRVGYGLTEATAATCLCPRFKHRKDSIGIPFPDTIYKIIDVKTNKECEAMEDGEICISGPTVMLGYLNDEEETNNVLRKHKDGRYYLHTGDIGCMDKDGYVYFKSRLKRMIVTSGYNVYPSYIEGVLSKHEYVSSCSVVGVPDEYRGQIIKAFVVLKKEVKLDEEVEKEIRAYASKYISKYALPKEYEFKKELPKTLVGKINYAVLEQFAQNEKSEKQKN